MPFYWENVLKVTYSQVWSLLSSKTGELVAYVEKDAELAKNRFPCYYAYIPSFELGCIGLGGHATLEEAQEWLISWAREKYGENH